MKIPVKVSQFCGLATSAKWQEWLYGYNQNLHARFVAELRGSRGCGANSALMMRLLETIEQLGDSDKLFSFLQTQFPYVLIQQQTPAQEHGIFNNFKPGLLTFPRRHIITGKKRILELKVQEFLRDKGEHDYVIIDDTCYIEFLPRTEEYLKTKIPAENWLTRRYKSKLSQR